MSIDKGFVLASLLQHNFLPMQKKEKEEMPPIFSSVTFTPDVARILLDGKLRKSSDYQGYDSVDYKLTRFNGVSRSCSIPHPVAYADLVLCIHNNWDKLDYIAKNKNSLIRPREHKDGRLIVMDYERSFEKTERKLREAFGQRFAAHTDIANFFPSVYSHAVPWAVVGFDHAKKHKSQKHKGEWFNQLDEKLRKLKRNETQGVAIGPATSNIFSEAILARVDDELSGDFSYFRYIDDYTAYCDTEDKAQSFIRRLAEELSKYGLMLNIKKTEVIPLPQALTADWIGELALRLPNNDELSGYDAVNYLNLAVQIAKSTPDGSVLKYALKNIVRRKLGFMAEFDIIRYALNLSFHQTALLPLLEPLLDATLFPGFFLFGDELLRIALENARYRRSDGMAWSLYYLNKYGVTIDAQIVKEIVASRDCVGLLLLYQSGDATHRAEVLKFVAALDLSSLYDLDQYWLLLYHLYCAGEIAAPYVNEDAFELMKANGVVFLQPTIIEDSFK
jgi:SAM-dependent methyltransferase